MSARIPAKARFTPLTGTSLKAVVVDFNPVSLQFSVSNTLKEEPSGKSKQYTTKGKGTGKLTMDLIFDNTADGSDVRNKTSEVSALMNPDPASSASKKEVPPIILFEWGVYKFQGMMESYKETLDFFSHDGVPLRASVNIGMVEQDEIFVPNQPAPNAVDVRGNGFSPAAVASAGGNPDAARGIGAFNASASLRFSAGASLSLTDSVTLGPPVGFATGGAGIGIGAGFGASAGVDASGGALFGGSASAGVSATQGAFAGLRASATRSSASIDTGRFLQASESVPLSTGAGDFSVGGQAVAKGNAGLSTDVGANVDLRARIQFEVE